jgi:hypothetical protein
MSIALLRQQLSDVPGASAKLCMRYENGGAVQVFFIGDKEARVDARANIDQIRAALLEAIA